MGVDSNYLSKVLLASDVYSLCVQHALTTEKQEIMGLLIGDVRIKYALKSFIYIINIAR